MVNVIELILIFWEDETDGESQLSLDVGDRLIGFVQSEIKSIEGKKYRKETIKWISRKTKRNQQPESFFYL